MVTVSDVKQYIYCPRIIYFDHVIHVPKPPDLKLAVGKEEHEDITKKERRRKGAIFYDPFLDEAEKLFKVDLESKALNLRGVLDYLIRSGREYVPVDYKFGFSKKGAAHLNHKYQLAAYALLVEDNFDTIVRRGYIHYSKDRINARIDFTDEVRDHTLKVISEIGKIVEEEIEPEGTRTKARCKDCEYSRYCENV